MTPHFLLFKASAGSGKTYNLAIQYIALLVAQGEYEFRHTLAVTFTNKATAEMKDRILEFLYDMWRGRGKSQEKVCATQDVLHKLYRVKLTDEEVRERCGRALHAILHDYSRFMVSTIDAFFQSVLRSLAHELRLTARLQVDLDDNRIIELAVESLIDKLRRDNKDVLPWLENYIEQQLEDGASWDVRRELKSVAKMLFREEYLKRSLDEHNEPFELGNIASFRKTLYEKKTQILNTLSQEATVFEEKLQGVDDSKFSNFNYLTNYARNLKQGILKNSQNKDVFTDSLQKRVDDPQELLKTKYRSDTVLMGAAQDISARLGWLREVQLREGRHLSNIDLILPRLTPMGLLGAIDKEVTQLAMERNRFVLARTAIMLRRMVQGEDASFIFERAGTQYHNIMIDEFQDTSRMQWENFCTLLLNNMASGGLNMVVGDIKQSIYRWRNGDWRILYGLDRDGYQGTPLEQNPLNDNFRSQGHIVTFNNTFFPKAAEALDQIEGEDCHQLQDIYSDVEQEIKREKEAGLVRIRLCKETKGEGQEAEEDWQETMLADLVEQVKSLHAQGVPYEEMTILLRKNSMAATIINYFSEHLNDVRLVSGEAFLLGASTAVRMVVEGLQVVDDVNRDPVALYDLVQNYRKEVLRCEENIPPAKASDYLRLLPEAFTSQLKELRHLPLYELCERIFLLLQIDKTANRQDAYLLTFFDEVSAYLHDNPSDIPTFLQYWEEKMKDTPIPSSAVEGIRIYTIHASKGLAFHTVLMPFAEWPIEKDYTMSDDLYWCMPTETPYNALGTLPIKFSAGKIKGTIFEEDYNTEHANRRADELNVLYVAFTRAKGNLLVWGRSEHDIGYGTQDETVADLMYHVLKKRPETQPVEGSEAHSIFTVGEVDIPKQDEKKRKKEGVPIEMQSFEGAFTFRQSGQAEEFIRQTGDETPEEERQLTYIEQGKLLHFIFSQIETAADIERVTAQFARQGVLKSEKQVEQVRQLACNGLRHEVVRDWFSGRYQLFNECNILIPDPDNPGHLLKRRPDRVMLAENRIIIVDFKFGKPDEEYKNQVKQYINILHDMYPTHDVEGWLWYVYKNKTERV